MVRKGRILCPARNPDSEAYCQLYTSYFGCLGDTAEDTSTLATVLEINQEDQRLRGLSPSAYCKGRWVVNVLEEGGKRRRK